MSEEYRQARRAQILDGARRCFLRRGFHATSMDDVLGEVGLSSGAVYGYFSGKDELILAIAEENMRQVAAVLADAVTAAGQRPVGGTLAEVLEVVRARDAESGFARMALLVWSEATHQPILAARLTALIDEMRAAFALPPEPAENSQLVSGAAFGTVLTSVVAGFILQLALGGPEAVEELPSAVRALWPGGGARTAPAPGGGSTVARQ